MFASAFLLEKDVKKNLKLFIFYALVWFALICFLLFVIYVFFTFRDTFVKNKYIAEDKKQDATSVYQKNCIIGEQTPHVNEFVDCSKTLVFKNMNVNSYAFTQTMQEILLKFNFFSYFSHICAGGSVCQHVVWKSIDNIMSLTTLFLLICLVILLVSTWSAYKVPYKTFQTYRMLQRQQKQLMIENQKTHHDDEEVIVPMQSSYEITTQALNELHRRNKHSQQQHAYNYSDA